MSLSAQHCPRCGQANQCAQASASTPVEHCWCFDLSIAPAALDNLPAEARARSCLCPRCARELPPTQPDQPAD
ncbi:cysteine-rich CWC family protein [Pseudomonas sp. XK-1]|uniref:cysteine-rich CWC family protein n=1 Tax=Pseudomonas sp. XK-1 TaxID=3136019 RepID=UPI00311A7D3A